MLTAASALPAAFIDKLSTLLSETDFQNTVASFSSHPSCAFRVNTRRTTPSEVLEELSIPVAGLDWYSQAYVADRTYRQQLTESKAFAEGRIYIQNPASMLAVVELEPKPGEEVLDLAAAPGGKTLMIADLMQNQGRIAAVEPVKGRFFRLKRNLETFGADIVECYLKDGRQVGWKVPERFDRVLLDAPCSSESRFNAEDPGSFSHWNERKVKEAQRKQKKLICSAIAALKPGGTLVYSTCSFSPEENEVIVQHALKKFGENISVEPLNLSLENFRPGLTSWKGKHLDASIGHCARVLPNETMHGFFLCKMSKHSSTQKT